MTETRLAWCPWIVDEDGRTVTYELDENGEVVAEIRVARD